MKRILSIILTIAMVITMSASFAFAEGEADANGTNFSDISGRVCEEAVVKLAEEGVISGYPDGSFQPDGAITRAEVCTILYKSIPKDQAVSTKSAGDIFSDMKDGHWADTYVVWCSQAGLVKGYPDGTFNPDGNVTNNELITILVRAKGLADDAAMSWPADYVEAAKGSGVTDGLDGVDIDADGSKPATRGNAAIMLDNSGELISPAEAGQDQPAAEDPATEPEPSQEDPVQEPSKPAQDKDDNILANASGYAYGFVVSTGQGLNSKGDSVPMIVFNMLDKEYTIMAKSSSSVNLTGIDSKSALVQVKLSNGEMTAINVIDGTIKKTKDAGKNILMTAEAADNKAYFCKVSKAGKTYITLADNLNLAENDSYIGMNTPVTVYTCEKDGGDYKYELGSTSDIREGCYVIAYSIDKDSEELADIVVVVDEDDVSECLNLAEASNLKGTLK